MIYVNVVFTTVKLFNYHTSGLDFFFIQAAGFFLTLTGLFNPKSFLFVHVCQHQADVGC